jgi:NAD(P)-dependent dehydrogenase (short-subunit alcohol dehydrogenase family)
MKNDGPLLDTAKAPNGEKLSASELGDRSNFVGKVVLITGCTNGLGAACIDEICGLPSSERPSKIIMVARNADLLLAKAEQCKEAGVMTSSYLAELTDVAAIFRVAKEVKMAEVKIDICALNAGMWQTHDERKVQADGLEVHFVANFLQQAIFAQAWGSMIPPGGRVMVMGSFTGNSISEGMLDWDHVGTPDGEHKKMLNGAIPYSQSKLMQHMWCKHVALKAPLADGVTLNVCCPGSVMTKIDTWQAFKSMVSCCYPCCKCCIGIRDPHVGCTSMMFGMGSKSMDGITGSFIDFGMNNLAIVPYKPSDLSYYPSQSYKVPAPSIADAAQCARLFNETNAKIEELKAKYPAN